MDDGQKARYDSHLNLLEEIRNRPVSEHNSDTETAPSPETAVPRITIIIPTRNEVANIKPLLTQLAPEVQDLNCELLFVDDSADNTPQVIAQVGAGCPFPVRCLARPPERRNGLSGAVVDGLRAARGEWVCVMDADLQHPPATIPQLWAQAQKTGADMVVGSRKGDLVGPLGLSRMRSLTSKMLTIQARMMFPRLLKNVSDPLTGLFLVRRTAVDPDLLRPDGFKILLEILVRCPDLHVTEIHFDFAPRHDGQSKADVQEGMRFFRHLMRLRLTVNPHLIRFLIVVLLGILGNTLLLIFLTQQRNVNYLWAAVFGAELTMLWNFIWFEFWVFSERELQGVRRRFLADFFLTQLFLLLVQLPVMYFLVSRGLANPVVANLAGILLVSLVRYGLSEQWIWTKGSMIWQHRSRYYDLHGILGIESDAPLSELGFFETAVPPAQIDLKIRLDRHGTPSRLPGGISYDERMGRFGFGLTVLPGEYTEVVVSPLLERSPHFLFTNIVEPVLRWSLVRKGFALVNAGCVTLGDETILLHGLRDIGPALFELCKVEGAAFLGDDLTILGRNGCAYSYPKPVTVSPEMQPTGSDAPRWRERWGVRGQRLLYSQAIRRLGLWLSQRDLPAATLNTYVQWLIPQPKYMLDRFVPGLVYGSSTAVSTILLVSHEKINQSSRAKQNIEKSLQQRTDSYSFQPQPLLASELSQWQREDLQRKELAIIQQALQNSRVKTIQNAPQDWWRLVVNVLSEPSSGELILSDYTPQEVKSARPLSFQNPQGKPKTS